MIKQVAIVYEDDNPRRLFVGDACLFKAYRWSHHHFCLADEGFKLHQLPEWLSIRLYLMDEEQINSLLAE